MLTEERFAAILEELRMKNAVSVTELVEKLGASESTIRRDLNTLDEMGKLKKVHGGATAMDRGRRPRTGGCRCGRTRRGRDSPA